MRYIVRVSFILAFLSGLIVPSFSAIWTQNLSVQVVVADNCSITSLNKLDFGTITSLSSPTVATTTISVLCANGAPYTIGFNAGLGSGATVSTRLMTGPSRATLNYSLYQDSHHTQVWGDTIGTNTVAGIGTASTQTYTVYGFIPGGQTSAVSGTYLDTVIATITY